MAEMEGRLGAVPSMGKPEGELHLGFATASTREMSVSIVVSKEDDRLQTPTQDRRQFLGRHLKGVAPNKSQLPALRGREYCRRAKKLTRRQIHGGDCVSVVLRQPTRDMSSVVGDRHKQ
jgi:hypothetical protein